jgi:aldose 1-epimerase
MTLQPPVVAGNPTVVLSSPTGSLSLHLLPSHGLTFHKLLVNGYDVLIGPESTESYLSEGRNFRNQVVGRYANRLPGGRWSADGVQVNLVGDGTWLHYHASTDTKSLVFLEKQVYLHGGPTGYDVRTWLPITRERSALFSSGNPSVEPGQGQEAIFQLRSPAGDQGFPEDLIIEAYVAVVGPTPTPGQDVGSSTGADAGVAGDVYYNLRAAIVPRESGPAEVRGTPINLTVHWGFNLEAGGDVLNHLLWLDVRPFLISPP